MNPLGARRLHAMDRSIRHTIPDREPMKVTTVCESCFQRITRELFDPYKPVAHFCSDCLSHGFDEAAA